MLEVIRRLLQIPDPSDLRGRKEITNLIQASTLRGGTLPDPDTVRERYRLRLPLDGGLTVGDWLDRWLAGRTKLRLSTRLGYACHIRLYLKPYLGHIRLDRLHAEDVAAMFEQIDDHNQTIRAARTSGDPIGTEFARAVVPPP